MGRPSFTPKFKLESVKLVKERGAAVREAVTDLGLHENILHGWFRTVEAHCELAKTKAKVTSWKKPKPTPRGNHGVVQVYRKAPSGIADAGSVRGARYVAGRVLPVVAAAAEPPLT